jgi:hypothetical protein
MGVNFKMRNKRISYRLLNGLLYVIVSMFVFSVFLKNPGINGYYSVMYGDMIYGKAYKPFVTRSLLPWMVRGTVAVLPQGIKSTMVGSATIHGPINSVFTKLGWESALAPEYLVGLFFMYLFLLLFMWSLKYFAKLLYAANEHYLNCFVLASVLLLPAFFNYYSHIYDFVTLSLFTLGVALQFAGNKYFVPVYILNCINKETAILIALIYFVAHYKEMTADSSVIKNIMLMAAIYLICRVGILFLYANNPGSPCEYNFAHNLGLINKYSFPQILSVLAFLVLLLSDWLHKPSFLKQALYIAVPMAVLALFWGRFDEPRAFYELLPVVLLLVFPTIARLMRVECRVRT